MALVALTVGSAQAAKKAPKDPVVMTIAGRDVHRSEFEYFYNKNTQQDLAEEKSFDEYVDLFINYKLKVAEALSRGIDTTQAYQSELAGYRAQLAEPYLQGGDAWKDALVQEVIDRRKEEVHAAHILLMCDESAPDSLVAAQKARIEALRHEVETGADFDSLARAVSEDPSAKQNGGDLGYFSALQMVYPFETAAYETPVGGLTVCRSRFGFHLIKVLDRRTSKGEVMVAHIMKMFPRPLTPAGQSGARHAIDSLYQLLKGGADFARLAELNSDDQYTAPQGGAYNWINSSARFPQEWLDVAFGLDSIGAYSEPMRTAYGWHIIKLLDRRDGEPDTPELREDLKARLSRDAERLKRGEAVQIAKWRQEHKIPAKMSDEEARQWADEHLAELNEDFRNIYREYHDGILLFDVSSGEVWDKAAQDSAGLHDYFLRHKSKYGWDRPRFRGAFIECADDSALVTKLKEIYEAEPDIKKAADRVRAEVLTDTLLTPDPKKPRFHIVNGLYSPGDNDAVDVQQLGLQKTVRPKAEMPVQMTYGKVLPAEPETEDDVRGAVIADYQTELQQKWEAQLREKYTWKINQKELDKLRK